MATLSNSKTDGPLDSTLRKQLERMVLEARKIATDAAREKLESLTVHEGKRGSHVSTDEDIELRNRLRAHARFLGDRQNSQSGAQKIDRLVEECAYQHWHRMLFARFLVENELLIQPDMGQAVSMDEIEELAHEEGLDKWELASRYAQKQLPAIFPADNPVLELKLAADATIKLTELLEEPASDTARIGLPQKVFLANDSLGWVYQFWQNEENKRANKSEDKIDSSTLPAVTQFFTEDYMVSFLLHNTLGAWHAGKVLAENPSLALNATSEEELRRAVRLEDADGYDFDYLRFVKVEEASSLSHPRTNEDSNSKSQDGSATFYHNWFDWKEPINELSGSLPHIRQEGVTYFVTFRTADSVPAHMWKEWHAERESWLKKNPEPRNKKQRQEYAVKFPERVQHWLDQQYGDCVLADKDVREIVENAIGHFAGERYEVDEFVVAANHVHVLVTPLGDHELSDILHSWKSFSANKINKQLNRTGRFWQKESFDHAVRSSNGLLKFRQYIRNHDKVAEASSLPQTQKSQDGSATWRPMGGTFDGWPTTTAELKVLDPCCGSGHFLVAAMELLVRLRMREEQLDLRDAIDSVLRDNLSGLELDRRCTQIAVFNLALAAWKLDGNEYRKLPSMTVAHVGQSVTVKRDQWMKVLGSEADSNTKFFFGQLYDMFSQASTLGSLINPRRFLGSDQLDEAGMDELIEFLESAVAADPNTEAESHELQLAAKGLATATKLLSGQYHLVLTNVPYLGSKKQSPILKSHIETNYELGKADLATAFILRANEFALEASSVGLVTPQNWLFLSAYSRFREILLKNQECLFTARLGAGAFETISGEVVSVALSAWCRQFPEESHVMGGIDAGSRKSIQAKNDALVNDTTIAIEQRTQIDNPDSRITLKPTSSLPLLAKSTITPQGVKTGDDSRWRRCFWAISDLTSGWQLYQSSVSSSTHYGGRSFVLDWKHEGVGMVRPRIGNEAVGKHGVAISTVGSLSATLYTGERYDSSVGAIVPLDEDVLIPLWCYCSSQEYEAEVRNIDQKVSVTTDTLAKVPFDFEHWLKIGHERYQNGLPEPESDDPTQWLFHGWPAESTSPLHVAVARMLGYRWPAELDSEMRLSERARDLVGRCQELDSFTDDDGIVCIPSLRGEDTAADRLGPMLTACGVPIDEDLDDWFRNRFFKEHCELFDQRPFIWHIWDGRKRDGFHALVNYHKLAGPGGHKMLERLTYSYLGDWIERQEDEVSREVNGAELRLKAANELKQRLEAILAGEPPYDIFVRWKPIHEQPIGWNPDINDGVRINIRPFMQNTIEGGLKDAGILRVKPSRTKWSKDRGKEPERPQDEYPWFWSWDEQTQDFSGGEKFDGIRWNDLHYSNEFKQRARDNIQAPTAES